MSLRPQTVDFDVMWDQIRNTAHKVIQLGHVPKCEWNDRFHDVYKLCVAFPEPLSSRVYFETKKLLDTHIKILHQEVVANPPSDLLNGYYQKWLIFQQGIEYLSTLYIYLNTQYIRKYRYSNIDIEFGDADPNEQLMEISELGAYLWKINMILPLQSDLVSLLLHVINEDRCGKPQNKKVIQSVINSFIFVEEYRSKNKSKLYQELFETPFLEATHEYYKREAKLLLEKNDCSSYMEQVLIRLDIERERLSNFLPKESHRRVIQECEKCMVGEYLDFLQNECRSMVKKEARKDLHNMFRLLKPVESGLQALIKQIEYHIKEKGLEIIRCLNPKDENYVQCFVEDTLKVYRHHLKLIYEVFNDDKNFIAALDIACTEVINYRENTKVVCRSPEILARYFDSLLKKSTKCNSELEIEEKLTQAINIFKYINDKDIFQKFYSKMLAKRLIYSQYISLDAEEMMINKLKQACGYEFTSKLHRMFTDIKVSEDLNHQFYAKLETENVKLPVTFSIYVLQACAWPLNQTVVPNFSIPQPFERALCEFEGFYSKKFSGRKLTWLHHLSNGEVKFLFTKKMYTVIMATYHISIILLYDYRDEYSYQEIQENTNLNDEQLQRHLQSFVEAKILLIDAINAGTSSTSSPNGSSLSVVNYPKEAKFTLNKNFNNKRIKFKLIVAQQKETQQTQQKETEQTHASIEEDRKLFLQAAIVRIMKSRKKMRHNLLIEEVISQSQSRFMPQVPMIKKAIESLIEKQYIERVSTSSDEYQYIA